MNTIWLARYRLVFVLVAVMFVSVGCVNTRMGVSWPTLDVANLNGEAQIIVAYNNQVTLINPDNGRGTVLLDPEGRERVDDQGNPRRWVLEGNEYDGAQFFADPIRLDDETFLFPAYNERLYEVDTVTARVTNAPGIVVDGPVMSEVVASPEHGLLYVPLKDDNVVALDAESYEVMWAAPRPEDAPEDVDVTGVWASPLLVDDTLYVPTIDHYLYALDAQTGEAAWQAPVNLEGAIVTTPIYDNGLLYVGSYAHKLFKINAASGEILASYEASNWIWNTPVLQNGILYFTDLSGYVYAVRASDMSEVWAQQVAERGIRPSPLVTDDSVIVASRDGKLYWLDRATGSVVFDREVEGRPEILSELLLLPADEAAGVTEDLVIVSTVDMGRLVAAFTLENGRLSWIYGR